jgi:hypothetical protein
VEGKTTKKVERRTDGSGLDHVANGESFDRLVLGCASRAIGAADRLDVAATLFVAATRERLKPLTWILADELWCLGYAWPIDLNMKRLENCVRVKEIPYLEALFLGILTDSARPG